MRKGRIRIKSHDDIKRIRDAGIIIADILRLLSKFSLAGISTWDIDSFIESNIFKKKARPAFKTVTGYSSSSCISINNEVVHSIPSKKRIVKGGDIVKIDIGVVLNGFFSDACYTFPAGEISESAKRLIDVTKESLNRAIEVMLPGNRIGDMGSVIQAYAELHGFSVVRNYTGHGVGFALHEPPKVPHYGKKGTGIMLKNGMVLAVEPIINEGKHNIRVLNDGWTAVTSDGKLSAQFEHSVAITEKGPIILTV